MHRPLTCPSGTSDIDASSVRLPPGHSRHRCIERPTAPRPPRTSMHRCPRCPKATSGLDASNADLPFGHLGCRCIEGMRGSGAGRGSMHRGPTCPRGRSASDASMSEVPLGQFGVRCIELRRRPIGRGGDVVAAKARTSGGNEVLPDEFADRVMRFLDASGRSARVGMARPRKRATATGTAARRSRVSEEGRASFPPCAMPRRARDRLPN
jgi:hypothetical protein